MFAPRRLVHNRCVAAPRWWRIRLRGNGVIQSGKRKGRPPKETYPVVKHMPLGLAVLVLRQHIEDHRALGLIVYLQFQLVTTLNFQESPQRETQVGPHSRFR
jgi:hypothetical protein